MTRSGGTDWHYFRCPHCGMTLGYEERDPKARKRYFVTMPGVDAVPIMERMFGITCECGNVFRLEGRKRTVRFERIL